MTESIWSQKLGINLQTDELGKSASMFAVRMNHRLTLESQETFYEAVHETFC